MELSPANPSPSLNYLLAKWNSCYYMANTCNRNCSLTMLDWIKMSLILRSFITVFEIAGPNLCLLWACKSHPKGSVHDELLEWRSISENYVTNKPLLYSQASLSYIVLNLSWMSRDLNNTVNIPLLGSWLSVQERAKDQCVIYRLMDCSPRTRYRVIDALLQLR